MNMSKIRHNDAASTLDIHCPGCQKIHSIPLNKNLDNSNHFFWNGNVNSPSVLPSVDINNKQPDKHCHFYLIDGKIHYLPDCFHEYQSQTVDLPDYF